MTRLQAVDRRRLHAFTASDLRPGKRRLGWDWQAHVVLVLAWAGLVTICVAVVAVGAGLGWVLWRVATAVIGGNGW